MSVVNTPEAQVVRFIDSNNLSKINSASHHYKSPWPMRRHTPYTKTPQSRRIIGKSGHLPRTPPDEALVNDWKLLVNKTWHTYCLTPLYNFSYNPSQLKKYSRHLSAQLKAEANKGTGVGTDEALLDRAVFRVFKGLAVGADDSEAVEVTVTSKRSGSTQTQFNAVLISVEADFDEAEQMKVANDFTRLPLLLVKGPAATTSAVLNFLQTEFDCIIKPLMFCPILKTPPLFLTEDSKKPIELLYSVPEEVKGLQSITMTIEAKDAKILWDRIHEEGSSEVTGEEVAAYIKSLECHFFRHFRVYLAAMKITRIGTTVAFVGHKGKLKILSENQVIHILAYLTELALANTAV
ncbi:centromere protein L-like [Anneissia japonica]|uniref:centromere protein L-like n=1 Tax=Anneissia japonica TaxID=1529436 RepID=UPI001425773F|nr:centromere protein L-like [Anneissia japonica]